MSGVPPAALAEPLTIGGAPYTGSGTAPAEVQARCRESFWARIDLLERIADGLETEDVVTKDGIETVRPRLQQRIAALGMLGKFGGLEKLTLEGGLSDDAAELLALAREARERASLPYQAPRPQLAP